MIERVISHVVFTVKNSRYDWQRIKRKKPAGFIAPTFQFFENEEEEFLIKIICDIAIELELKIAAFNFCGDHVHAVLINDNPDISRIMGLWKGNQLISIIIEFKHLMIILNQRIQKMIFKTFGQKVFIKK